MQLLSTQCKLLFMDNSELKLRRERLGLTQGELAEILGVAGNTIWRYEKGSTEIPKHMEFTLESLERRQIENLKQQIGDAK